MENELRKKKTAAPDTSVGADDGQPLHNSTENSISAFDEEINGDFQNSTESLDEIYRRIQRLTDPHYLHTISMTELYQTAYQSRPPIIDGLLYAGAYILAGQAAGDVVLLRQPGELDKGFDLRIFLRRYPEGNGLVAPAVVVVSVFQ